MLFCTAGISTPEKETLRESRRIYRLVVATVARRRPEEAEEPRRRHRRARHRQLSRRSALQASMLDNKTALQRVQEEARRQRLLHQRAELPRQSAASRSGRAKHDQEISRKTILLAEKLGVPVVIDFSGCPGDCDNAKYPNWVTCPWPPEYLELLKWQWEKKVTPYWKEHGQVRRRPRRESRHRNASGLRGLQPGDHAEAARHRRHVGRLQLRSEPHVLAGHRSHRRHPRAGRLPSFTSTPKTPRSTSATCR